MLEASPYLEEDTDQFEGNMTSIVKMVVEVSKQHKYEVDWDLIRKVITERDSIPVEIGRVTDELLEEYREADKTTRASSSNTATLSSSPVVQQ